MIANKAKLLQTILKDHEIQGFGASRFMLVEISGRAVFEVYRSIQKSLAASVVWRLSYANDKSLGGGLYLTEIQVGSIVTNPLDVAQNEMYQTGKSHSTELGL